MGVEVVSEKETVIGMTFEVDLKKVDLEWIHVHVK